MNWILIQKAWGTDKASHWKRGRPGAWVYAFVLVGAGLGAFLIAPESVHELSVIGTGFTHH